MLPIVLFYFKTVKKDVLEVKVCFVLKKLVIQYNKLADHSNFCLLNLNC